MRKEHCQTYVLLTDDVLADQVSDFLGFWLDSERSIDEMKMNMNMKYEEEGEEEKKNRRRNKRHLHDVEKGHDEDDDGIRQSGFKFSFQKTSVMSDPGAQLRF